MPKPKVRVRFSIGSRIALALRHRGFETLTPSGLRVLYCVMAGMKNLLIIAKALKCHHNQVYVELRRLEKRGLVTFERNKAATVQPKYQFIKAEDL